MKAYGGIGLELHSLLTSALAGNEWYISRLDGFVPDKTDPGISSTEFRVNADRQTDMAMLLHTYLSH
jgi:hypothetical protein